MTSHVKGRQEKERKVKELVAFAKTLSRRLRNDPSNLTDLKPAVSSHLTATFPLPAGAALHAKRETLDGLGTDIWNLATQLGRDDAAAPDKKTICSIRQFAVLVLNATAPAAGAKDGGGGGGGGGGGEKRAREAEKGVRILKVALKAAKASLEAKMVGETGLMRVLECAADWEARLKTVEKAPGDVDVDCVEVMRRLRAEYWILRTAHAWRQSRLDIAEQMFSNGDLEPNRLAPDTADMLTDALFEIGRDVFSKRQYEDAAKWLDRAFSIIGERNLEELDQDAVELRMSILNYLVRSYLGVGNRESKEKARGIVEVLEQESGDKMIVQLLRLDVLSADSDLDIEDYSTVVSRMGRSVVLTDASFKTIMHHVHKIKGKSPEMASQVLESLLHTRLFTHRNPQWIEKVVVTLLWITVESTKNQPPESLLELLEVVLQNSRPFDAPATHAAQTLLWKQIEIVYSQGKFHETELWCNIALHPLFERAEELNRAKISRKIILCAVARQDHNAARKIFFEMSESAKRSPMTRYLMYKSAIRDSQPEFAAECLDVICRQSGKDATLLYACVMEAQHCSDKRQSVLALQKVLEKHEYGAPIDINLPALLRSTIRLLAQHLGGTDNINEDVMAELCKAFEGAAAQATKAMRHRNCHPSPEQAFTKQELEWFSRNSYNISLKYCGFAHPSNIFSLLEKCIQFIGLLQAVSSDAENESSTTDLVLRLLLCHYLASCAAVVLARSTDSVDESLTAYTAASTHAKAFRLTAAPHLRAPSALNNRDQAGNSGPSTSLGAATRADLAAKRAQLLRYELESALKRCDWDALNALWEECFDISDTTFVTSTSQQGNTAYGKGKDRTGNWYTRHLETLADLALVIHAELTKADTTTAAASSSHFLPAEKGVTSTSTHRARILGVLQRIVNQSWQKGNENGGADVVHLARWIRCLFQLSLQDNNHGGGCGGGDSGANNTGDEDLIPLQCVEQATAVISSVGIGTSSSSRHHLGADNDGDDDDDDDDDGDKVGAAVERGNAYPRIEADWLAATAFNRGIDFFCAGDDRQCRLWCDKALGLAKAVEKGSGGGRHGKGGGGLYGTLMEKYKSLLWGDGDEEVE